MLVRRLIILVLSLCWACTAQADSMVLGQHWPMAEAMFNGSGWYSTMEYQVTNSTSGHLLVKANKYVYTNASGAQSFEKNTSADLITIQIDVTRDAFGNIGFQDDAYNVLSVTDHLGTLQFFSAKIYGLEFNSGQFKVLWRKDDGAAAKSSPLPFIGSIIHPNSTITSASFNSSFGPVFVTTDVFMTPVPTAATAGLGLMISATGVSLLRRRKFNFRLD